MNEKWKNRKEMYERNGEYPSGVKGRVKSKKLALGMSGSHLKTKNY